MHPLGKSRLAAVCLLCLAAIASAQQTQSTATVTVVPKLVHFAGSLHLPVNQPTGPVGATFAIYGEPEGGTPLWSEDQNVELHAVFLSDAALAQTAPARAVATKTMVHIMRLAGAAAAAGM